MEAKKYCIDINKFYMMRNILENFYPENIYELELIDFCIKRLNNDFFTKRISTSINRLRRDSFLLDKYKKFYPYIRTFVKKGIYIETLFQPNYHEIIINDNEALNIAGNFYSDLDLFFKKQFDSFYNEASDHLEFIKPNINTEGEIHFFESFGEAFAFIPDYPNFTKVSILIHELEHIIDSFSNPKFYTNLVIREVTAMFMEIIGCDYLEEVLDIKGDSNVRKFYIYAINKMNADDLAYKIQLLHLIRKNKQLKNKDLMNLLINEYNFSKNVIDELSNYSLEEDYYYQISLLCAIELYYIYKKDKDLALYIIKDIILNANDDNIFEYLNKYNINLNERVFCYEDELCLHLGI